MCLSRRGLWITIARRAAAILAQASLIGHKNKPSPAKSLSPVAPSGGRSAGRSNISYVCNAGPAAETDTLTLFANNLSGQLGYSHSFDYDVRNRNRLAINFLLQIPLARPLSLKFQAHDFANILTPTALSLKTFKLTTGLSLSY